VAFSLPGVRVRLRRLARHFTVYTRTARTHLLWTRFNYQQRTAPLARTCAQWRSSPVELPTFAKRISPARALVRASTSWLARLLFASWLFIPLAPQLWQHSIIRTQRICLRGLQMVCAVHCIEGGRTLLRAGPAIRRCAGVRAAPAALPSPEISALRGIWIYRFSSRRLFAPAHRETCVATTHVARHLSPWPLALARSVHNAEKGHICGRRRAARKRRAMT